MKKLIYLIFLIFSFNLLAQNHNEINELVNSFNKNDVLKHGFWGVYAEYIDTGEIILDLNSEKSLSPASGLKVFISSAGLHYLGENYRYETKIYYDGDITESGILNGNIYIAGSGDPTLGSDQVKGSLDLDELMLKWVNAVISKGIKKIAGSVIADDLLFDRNPVPDYYPWIDMGNYYGAGTSAICIHDNLYYLYFTPAVKVGGNAEVLRTEPVIPGLTFINEMKTGEPGSGDNGYIYCAPLQYSAKLRGTIPAGVKEFSIKGSIPDPALFAAQYLTNILMKNKIDISGEALKINTKLRYEPEKLLITTISPSLKDIVFIIDKRSNNLYTEQLLKTIALKETGIASTKNGIEVVVKFLNKSLIPTDGIRLFDGSGLSKTNIITVKAMVKLLSFNTRQNYFESFYNSLGIAGDPADISSYKNYGLNTAIAKNARLKTGTINGVRSHSGYLRTKTGRMIAFSFIANNYSGRIKQIDDIHIQLMIKLAELE